MCATSWSTVSPSSSAASPPALDPDAHSAGAESRASSPDRVALLPAVVLWYLNTEGVKQAFIEGEVEAGRGFANDYEREVAQRMAAERADDSMS